MRKKNSHSILKAAQSNNLALSSPKELSNASSLGYRKVNSGDSGKNQSCADHKKISTHEQIQSRLRESRIRNGFPEVAEAPSYASDTKSMKGGPNDVSSKPNGRKHEEWDWPNNNRNIGARGISEDRPNQNVMVTPQPKKLSRQRGDSDAKIVISGPSLNAKPPLHPFLSKCNQKIKTGQVTNKKKQMRPLVTKYASTRLYGDPSMLLKPEFSPEKRKVDRSIVDLTTFPKQELIQKTQCLVNKPSIVQTAISENKICGMSVTISPTQSGGTFLVSFHNSENPNRQQNNSHRADGSADRTVGPISQPLNCMSSSMNERSTPAPIEGKASKFGQEIEGKLPSLEDLNRNSEVHETEWCSEKKMSSPTKLLYFESCESRSIVLPSSTKACSFVNYRNEIRKVTPKHTPKRIEMDRNSSKKRSMPLPTSLQERMEHLKNEEFISNVEAA